MVVIHTSAATSAKKRGKIYAIDLTMSALSLYVE
jgi:hypothetical protein